MTYAEIIIPLALDSSYHYIVPDSLLGKVQLGHRVIVQFGPKRIYTAIVISISDTIPKDIDLIKIKSIEDVLDKEPIVNSQFIELIKWTSEYYFCPLGTVLENAIPSLLLTNSTTLIYLNSNFTPTKPLPKLLNDIIFFIKNSNNSSVSINKIESFTKRSVVKEIEQLLAIGAITKKETIEQKYKPRKEKYIYLSELYQSEIELSSIIDNLKKTKAQQQALISIANHLSYYHENKFSTHILLKTIIQRYKISYSCIRTLIRKGILLEEWSDLVRINSENNSVSHLHKELPAPIKALSKGVNLLWSNTIAEREEGILVRVKETLESGRQVLILTPSAYNQPTARKFISAIQNIAQPYKTYFYHSLISEVKRAELFKSINNNKNPFVVIGSRTALFLPFNNLGLTVIDHEHEYMYKEQLRSPRYHARDLAIIKSSLSSSNILLCSSTPSVETVFNTLRGKYNNEKISYPNKTLNTYKDKFDIQIVDIKKQRSQRAMPYNSSISLTLRQEIKATLDNHQRVLLIQNRRGYSSFIACSICSNSLKCPYCDISLNYYKESNNLLCHYCGYSTPLPHQCPSCNNSSPSDKNESIFKLYGYGSEKIEEEINTLFPEAKTLRIDSDSLQNKQQQTQIQQQIIDGDVDVIIGTPIIRTQPIWDNIYLIAIIQIESIIGFPDFRAGERALQLIYSLINSISEKRDGHTKLLIQTTDPTNNFITQIQRKDYNRFIHEELKERELYHFSPFFRLTRISVRGHNMANTKNYANILSEKLKKLLKNSIVSPAYQPVIAKINNLYYQEIMVRREFRQSHKNETFIIKQILAELSSDNVLSKNINVVIDRDPM